jgi:hypothetical protein
VVNGSPVSAQQIGARFNLVSAVPATILVAFVTVLALAGAPGDAPDADRAVRGISGLKAVDIGLLLLGTVVLALVLHPFQLAFVKALEGYGPATGPLAPLRRWCLRRYQARYEHLRGLLSPTRPGEAIDEAERKRINELREWATGELMTLPREARLLPTSLGNALRCAEDHAGRRYGLEAVEVIPRLFPLMPPSMTAYIDDARNELDLMTSLVLVWLIASAVALLALFQYGPLALVALATYGLAWMAYRGSVAAARAYGETLVWAMDLYRFNLYEQLRIDPPTTHDAELRQGERVMGFLAGAWARSEPMASHWGPSYRHPQPAEVAIDEESQQQPLGPPDEAAPAA